MTDDLARTQEILDWLDRLAARLDEELRAKHAAQVAECKRKHAGRPSLPGRLEALELGQSSTRHLVTRGCGLAREGIMQMLTAAGAYPGPTQEVGER